MARGGLLITVARYIAHEAALSQYRWLVAWPPIPYQLASSSWIRLCMRDKCEASYIFLLVRPSFSSRSNVKSKQYVSDKKQP